MSKFLKLMSILAIVALIAVPAFAEVQNVKVSGDIDTKAINRSNYDFSNGNSGAFTANANYRDSDTWFMTTARVQIDADLTDNVSTSVRLLNERDWDVEAGATTEIALDLASVSLKEFFYSPLTLKIGRQNLRFGSGLVVGDPDTNDIAVNNAIYADDLSVRKSFDAIRATFDYNPLVLDLIMAKIDANNIGVGDAAAGVARSAKDDVDLYGVNAAYQFDSYNSAAEAYLFAKIDRSDTTASPITDTVYVYGVRGNLEPISKLVLDAEVALQDGDFADTANNRKVDRKAWAGDIGGSYAIDYKWSPKIAVRYSYRSGQKATTTQDANVDVNAASTEYKAWDTMFEDQTHGIIANQIFDGNNDGVDSNGQTINVSASVVPVQDLTVAVDYYHYLLAEKWNSLGVTGSSLDDRTGNTGTTYEVTDKKDLGDEVDLSLAYDYTEDVKLGLTAGFFLPGSTFQKTNDNMASTVMADVKVSF